MQRSISHIYANEIFAIDFKDITRSEIQNNHSFLQSTGSTPIPETVDTLFL